MRHRVSVVGRSRCRASAHEEEPVAHRKDHELRMTEWVVRQDENGGEQVCRHCTERARMLAQAQMQTPRFESFGAHSVA